MNPLLRANSITLTKVNPEGSGGFPQLKSGQEVTSKHLRKLADQLEEIGQNWGSTALNANPVVSAYYSKIVPKSSRMKRLLRDEGTDSDGTVVGAKYWQDGGKDKHQIVHCLTATYLMRSVADLRAAADVLDKHAAGFADSALVKKINHKDHRGTWNARLANDILSRTSLCQTIVDACFVERFGVDNNAPSYDDEVIVTLYETDLSTSQIFDKAGITYTGLNDLGESTVVLSPGNSARLKSQAPYLIAMSLVERTTIVDDSDPADRFFGGRSIPSPSNEPVIGVIDTLFDSDIEHTYFSEWVDPHELVDPDIERTELSYLHGTCVDSIIVDGPALNPLRDDGCGRFQVRHFGVTADQRLSVLTLLRNVEGIVKTNRDIKVWNLSLGSPLTISSNSVSPVAALLDRIQRECDVIFVVAGTNLPRDYRGDELYRLGSPADSVNALVVNAVDGEGHPASYSRVGPVLHSFTKPDVAYFGGDSDEACLTWANKAEHYSRGTSYAAPWIARKLAYLIEIIGLSKEAAKALIIDSASRWDQQGDSRLIGHGVVPTHINDILQCPDDEIRLIVSGVAGPNKTSNFDIPVPKSKGKQPYYGKATLCYFPSCTRSQGVDYTNTEIELKFGRIKNGEINSINDDHQGEAFFYVNEEEARQYFQKWDNAKIVRESAKSRAIPKKAFTNSNWGFSLVAKKRLDATMREELPFGLVLSLKAMDGVNRLDTFLQHCRANRVNVDAIDIAQSVEFYQLADEDILFDD